MLSITLRLKFLHLKIIRILHSRKQPRIIGHLLKYKQKKECLFSRDQMKMKMKMKNISHRYNISKRSSRRKHKYRKQKRLSA